MVNKLNKVNGVNRERGVARIAIKEAIMNTLRKLKNKDGSALVVTVCFMAILLTVTAAMLALSSYSMNMSRQLHEDAAVLALAEAGVGDLLGRYGHNYKLLLGSSVSTNFGGGLGTFTASAAAGVGASLPTILVTGTGTIGGNTRETVLELLFTRKFHGAILAGGDIKFSDGAGLIVGDIHANGKIHNTTGASKKIDGTASAVGTVGGVAATNEIPGHGAIDIPEYLPFDEWEAIAIANGEWYEGNLNFPGMSNTKPNGGLMYVTGNVSFGQNSRFEGHLVAGGSITIAQRFVYIPTNTNAFPFAMLAGLDIDIGQLSEGLVGDIWAAGQIDVANNTELNGSLIAKGDVNVGNRLILTVLPEDLDEDELVPVMGGWVR